MSRERAGTPAETARLGGSTRFRTALVTGASSGIGRELALRLAGRGTHVVAAARREEELARLADEAARSGGRVDPAALDVRDADRVREVVTAWQEELGGLDLVVANAGVGGSAPATRLACEGAVETLRVNLVGAAATLVAALPDMLRRERGTLAAVSSLAGILPMPASGTYSASKAGLSAFLQTLAIDLAGTGVDVCDLRPGFVDTPLVAEETRPMPFRMDAGRAAEECLGALERGRVVHAFPRPLAWTLGLLRHAPEGLWRRVARRWARPPEAGVR